MVSCCKREGGGEGGGTKSVVDRREWGPEPCLTGSFSSSELFQATVQQCSCSRAEFVVARSKMHFPSIRPIVVILCPTPQSFCPPPTPFFSKKLFFARLHSHFEANCLSPLKSPGTHKQET